MKGLIIFLVCLCLISCDSGMYELVSRPQNDPYDFSMKVDSFDEENKIKCSWEKDLAADKYILMRSDDMQNLKFKEIYSGEDLSYIDMNLPDNKKYIYRLDKIRGSARFIGTKHFLGVYNDKKRDEYEPNDIKWKSCFLEDPKRANLYYYSSYDGAVIEDVDWYKVKIKPKRMVEISITYSAGQPVFIVSLPPNGDELKPASDAPFKIRNDDHEEKYFYFKVKIDKTLFSPLTASTFYTYTLKLISEAAIQD